MPSQVPSGSEKQTPGDTSNQQQKGGVEGKPQDEVPAPQLPSESTNASLYVGDLALSVDEDKLKAKFSTVGQVLSTRVCRDAVTHQSLRYGYVAFQTPEDGRISVLNLSSRWSTLASYPSAPSTKKALVNLNFDDLDGQPMRIMWCQRDPALRRSGLFLKNLADHVDSKTLYETFSMFGAILSCKVVLDQKGRSRGFGFIHFEKRESAKQAIEKVDKMELGGKKIFISEFVPFERRYSMTAETYTNVYVKNFDESVDEAKLHELFSKYGKIKSVAVDKSPNGPPGKAYGYVDFENHDDAVKAVAELDGIEWQGSKLNAHRAMRKAGRESVLRSYREKRQKERELRNLYVQWIGDAITSDEDLQKEFCPYGTIMSAKIMRDEQGYSRHFGFVVYERVGDAKRALQAMHGKSVNGRPILVALAMLKEKRREELTRQFAQPNRFQRGYQQSLYSRASETQQQMVGLRQMRGIIHPSQYVPVRYGHPAQYVYGNRQIPGTRLHASQVLGGVPRQTDENYTNVYVKNFDESVDEAKLHELFSKYGKIKSVAVDKSPNGPPGKAFGFVDFENHGDAVKAVAEVDRMVWRGSKLKANRAMTKAERKESMLRSCREQT